MQTANDTKHGLVVGIFAREGAHVLGVDKKSRPGIVWVNTHHAVSPIVEFGGMKHAGDVLDSSFQGMYDDTRPKTVRMNAWSEPLDSQFLAR